MSHSTEIAEFCERVEQRLEQASAAAPGYYDDVILIMREEAGLQCGCFSERIDGIVTPPGRGTS